ncbi:hypothetical protein L2E82_32474 [Cichorium intybus]|uniref:Uncharacterized protein n=1 Tax=Cichorium intybus TaxID=13427 RepID=A0ACB9BG35_CICIN|nr:hypothetical protein L2E82_32474 [Cichorium intybus]
MAGKGKGIRMDYLLGKRNRDGGRKTMWPSDILSGFSDEEDSIDDVFLKADFGSDRRFNAGPKTPSIPHFPKKEQIDDWERDKFLEEHYKPCSNFVNYSFTL